MGLSEKKATGLTAGYRAGIFVNVVLICGIGTAVACGLVALVRGLSFQHDLRFDVTRDARYELDPLAKQIVRSIQTPVDVAYIWGFDKSIQDRVRDMRGHPRQDLLSTYYWPILSEAQRRIRWVLDEWARTNPQIRVLEICSELNPTAAEDAARARNLSITEMLNSVVMFSGNRRRDVPLHRMMADMQWGYFFDSPVMQPVLPRLPGAWRVHEELTAALNALSTGEPVRIALPVGKDAMVDPTDESFQILSSILNSEGYVVDGIDLTRSDVIAPSLRAIVLPGLKNPLLPQEIELLRRYEASGGRLLILSDPMLPENYEALLEPYGATAERGIVSDLANQDPKRAGPEFLSSSRFCVGIHPIDTPLLGRIEIFLGPTRPIVIGKDAAPAAERFALLRAAKDAEIIGVDFHPTTGEYRRIESRRRRETAGPTLAAALKRPVQGEKKEARVVVVGGGSLLEPEPLLAATHFGNRDFLLNALGWLTEREETIGLRPRGEVQFRLIDLGRARGPLFWVSAVALPLLAALIGLVVYFVRRS